MFGLQWSTIWDLFLATLPVIFAHMVVGMTAARWPGFEWMRRIVLLALWLFWLAWLPNTCYLLTEWRHLLEIVDNRNLAVLAHSKPKLYLVIGRIAFFYFCFSSFGVATLVLAIRPIERLLRVNRIPFWPFAIPLFVMLSTGVYLGLILRFNSWNLATHPSSVFKAVGEIVGRPAVLSTVLFFGLLLWGLYEAIDLWIDALEGRVAIWKKPGRSRAS